jgi:hypothetical protein
MLGYLSLQLFSVVVIFVTMLFEVAESAIINPACTCLMASRNPDHN